MTARIATVFDAALVLILLGGCALLAAGLTRQPTNGSAPA